MTVLGKSDFSEAASVEAVHAQAGMPALTLDHDRYRAELAGFDMTEEQENELLGILWSLMGGMVELGFSHDLCGQILEEVLNVPPLLSGTVESGPKER